MRHPIGFSTTTGANLGLANENVISRGYLGLRGCPVETIVPTSRRGIWNRCVSQVILAAMDVLQQLCSSLGCTPSALVEKGRSAERSDLQRLIGQRSNAEDQGAHRSATREIWPLISHHTFNAHNPFGITETGVLRKKTLMLLLTHHGVVASDPLVEVERLWRYKQVEASLARLNVVIRQMAQVEPLVSAGLMRFDSSRPAFTDPARRSVLEAFKVTPEFGDFTYLIEAYEESKHNGRKFEIVYAQDVYILYDKLGQVCPPLHDAFEAFNAMRVLGEALIQLSWQFAVCSGTSACDITVSGELERSLFHSLVSRWGSAAPSSMISRQMERTRHFNRLSLGNLPNIDSMNLSVKDAVVLRKHKVFEEFRHTLTGAIDDYETHLQASGVGKAAQGFAEAMDHASHAFQNQSRLSPIRLASAGLIPFALSTVATLVPKEVLDPTSTVALAGFLGVVGNWAVAATRPQGQQVAVRYCVELGAPST